MKYINVLEGDTIIATYPLDNDVIERAVKLDVEIYNRDNELQRNVVIVEKE